MRVKSNGPNAFYYKYCFKRCHDFEKKKEHVGCSIFYNLDSINHGPKYVHRRLPYI